MNEIISINYDNKHSTKFSVRNVEANICNNPGNTKRFDGVANTQYIKGIDGDIKITFSIEDSTLIGYYRGVVIGHSFFNGTILYSNGETLTFENSRLLERNPIGSSLEIVVGITPS